MLNHHHTKPQTPSRVVVLGANGFVGRKLVGHLTEKKIPVTALGRDRVDLAADDATDRLIAELCPEDAVVFLAALTPDKGRGVGPILTNLRMGVAVSAALERAPVSHAIYISSDAVYPFRAALISEDCCAEPTDLYAAMHLSREIMVKQAAKSPVAFLRPTLIYGGGDTHNSYGPNRFRRMARTDARITLFGEGEETRDHVFVDDVAAVIELVLQHRSAGLLNIATGHSVSYARLAEMVAALFPRPIDIVGTPRQNPVTHRSFDTTAVHRSFPNFAFTPIEQGLAAAHRDEEAPSIPGNKAPLP